MKFLVLAAFAALSAPAFAQMIAEDCQGVEKTADRINCWSEYFDQEDANLNANYQEIKRVASSELFGPVQTAQRTWMKFRDEACAANKNIYKKVTGTGFAAEIECKARITSARAVDLLQLSNFLNENTEGNEVE